MKEQYKQTEDHIYKFDSPFDFIDFVGRPTSGKHSCKVSGMHTDFTGVETYEDAKKVSFEGFDISNTIATLAELEKVFDSQEIITRHDVQGAFVDVGAYMSGEPECMVEFMEDERPNNSVKIVFNVAESSTVKIQQIMNRAACVAGVIEYLENRGVSTEVHLMKCSNHSDGYSSGTDVGIFVKVKESGERLNINLLTGIFHPAFYRRIIFNLVEKIYPKSANASYGYPIKDQKTINEILTKAGFSDIENIIQAKTVTQLGASTAFKTFASIKENAEKMIESIDLKLNI